MRVTLFWNERAGRSESQGHPADDIRRGGHEVVQEIRANSDAPDCINRQSDLVVAAGGDGTVRKAARAAINAGLPLAILPMGTANNIAHTFRIHGSISELAGRWRNAAHVAVDMGVVSRAGEDSWFIESVGIGLMPAIINAAHREPKTDRVDQFPTKAIAHALARYRTMLPAFTAQPWTVEADGRQIDDAMVMVEVLNMPSVGPNLVLCNETNPSDGLLSVVMVGQRHRADLAALLESCAEGGPYTAAFDVVHARHVLLTGRDAVHVDDRVFAAEGLGEVSIRVQPGALTLLV